MPPLIQPKGLIPVLLEPCSHDVETACTPHSTSAPTWQSSRFAEVGKSQRPDARGVDTRLAAEFAGRNSLAADAVRRLYRSLCESRNAEVAAAFQAWQRNFSQIGGPDLEARRPKLGKLADSFGIVAAGVRPAELLFALHTYYALIVRLVGRVVTEAKQLAPAQPGDNRTPFDWIDIAPDAETAELVETVTKRIAAMELILREAPFQSGVDLFQPLYEMLFPKPVRHALGEYYTPPWLAEHVLDLLGYDGNPQRRLLDPACGSGVFLLAALRRIRAWHASQPPQNKPSAEELRRLIRANIVGCDLNPLAVLAARTNYLLALADLPAAQSEGDPPIHLCDSILAPPDLGTFEFVAGNPPWVAWDNLPEDYREATKPLWAQYGLFSLSGTAARHGGGKKDLSMLMLYAAADRHLADGGKLGFIITQTLLQTGGAGDGFRRFRLGEQGAWLGVTRVDDFVAARPFDAANWTCALILERGKQTAYPVTYCRWTRERPSRSRLPGGTKSESTSPVHSNDSERHGGRSLPSEPCLARPIDPARPNSPWLIESASRGAEPAYITGPSDYQAHLGANTGGANGVFWLRILRHAGSLVLVENLAERSKKPVPCIRQWIEPDLLYPLARWSDVARYCIAPSAHILLTQDPATRTGLDEARLSRNYPLTYAYLKQFEPLLRRRAAYLRYQGEAPFYSMYDVGGYTLAPHKVVWRRMDKRLNAAAAGEIDDPFLGLRPIVPQETCVLVACDSADEAHYLCALLNSDEIGRVVESHSVRGGKGFGTPGMMAYLNLRRFDPADSAHLELVQIGRGAHRRSQISAPSRER